MKTETSFEILKSTLFFRMEIPGDLSEHPEIKDFFIAVYKEKKADVKVTVIDENKVLLDFGSEKEAKSEYTAAKHSFIYHSPFCPFCSTCNQNHSFFMFPHTKRH